MKQSILKGCLIAVLFCACKKNNSIHDVDVNQKTLKPENSSRISLRKSQFDFRNLPKHNRAMSLNTSEEASEGFSDATWINNAGQIVGGSCINDCNGWEAYSFYQNKFEHFGTFGGFASEAYGINNSGQIVGQSDTEVMD